MRLYVLVRDDLPSKSQQAVQAGHALAQFGLEHKHHFSEWNNNFLIYLKIDSEEKLLQLHKELKEDDYKAMSLFKEPDLNNSVTALAVYGPGLSYRLQKFNLM